MTPEQVKKFSDWLTTAGAEVLEPTNEFEVLRFRTGAPGVSVVYRRKNGRGSYTGEADAAWRAFNERRPWRAMPKAKRKAMTATAQKLLERDGDRCFYCGGVLGEDVTVEHMVPHSFGGTNHRSNLALAHERCNQDAGNLSVVEKVAMRDRIRARGLPIPPPAATVEECLRPPNLG